MAIISAGRHPAVARNWEFGWTKGGDGKQSHEQVAIMFEIVDGPDKGRFIPCYLFFTDTKMGKGTVAERTLESLRYCGWQGDDVTNLDGLDRFMVELQVEHETQQQGQNAGQQLARVRFVNKFGGSALTLDKPMDDKEKRTFAAKMKNLARKIGPVNGTEAPKQTAGTPATDAPPREPSRNTWSDHGNAGDAPPPRDDRDAPPPSRSKAHDDIPF